MKSIVLVIAEKVFRDEEYQRPKEILQNAGFKVVTASTTTDTAYGKLGMEVKPDILVSQVDPDSLDALVFVGGGGAEQYFQDATAHELARTTHKLGKIVAAICIAPVILAEAGLLKGRRATVFPDGAERIQRLGATYTAHPVEIDGKIVTGNGPEAASEFGHTLVKLLSQ